MPDYIFGANILENLTTGMYKDSKVIYREYIQNACDQIDKAVKEGILERSEGSIKIWLDYNSRSIVIEDNATGIPAASFKSTLGNIADSDKRIGENKGFRGIGRLCGLAYCNELVFTSSAKGEDIISIMICDAQKMRKLIVENERGKKHTAVEILHAINQFRQEKTEDIDSHFFRVELNDINQENTDLLDSQQVKDYLSFVAPVPYQNTFIYRSKIYAHSNDLGIPIDEYHITLNGEQIRKNYTTILKKADGTKYDDIFDVHFKDFYDDDGELLAWMWVGLSKFQGVIPKINQMRGLRLRKDNIQIGGEDSLQKLFKEDRGNSYFVGEVFAIDKDLIPNSQRDYFNENPTRAKFEFELKKYFNDELNKIYREGSELNSAIRKIDIYEKKEAEFKEKETSGAFINNEHRQKELQVVLTAQKEAESAHAKIERMKSKANDLMKKVIKRIEVERPRLELAAEVPPSDTDSPKDIRAPYRTEKFSKYSRSERKLISKIFELIMMATDNETAEKIINKIEEGLQ